MWNAHMLADFERCGAQQWVSRVLVCASLYNCITSPTPNSLQKCNNFARCNLLLRAFFQHHQLFQRRAFPLRSISYPNLKPQQTPNHKPQTPHPKTSAGVRCSPSQLPPRRLSQHVQGNPPTPNPKPQTPNPTQTPNPKPQTQIANLIPLAGHR